MDQQKCLLRSCCRDIVSRSFRVQLEMETGRINSGGYLGLLNSWIGFGITS